MQGSWERFLGVRIVAIISQRTRFNFATNTLQFRLRISCILAAIGPRSGRDWATIAPRSGRDRGPGRSSTDVFSIGGDSTMQTPRLRLDHAAIAARSSRDLRVLPEPLDTIRWIIKRLEGHDRAIAIHSPRPSDGNPTVLMKRTVTWLQKLN